MKNNLLESILYVEDEKIVQKDIAEILEDYCETLYLADDGKQGYAQFIKHNPELIITDIRMPFMTGIDMSKEIRKICKDVNIIFITAFNDTDYFQEAIELQVNGYILKPTKIKLLINKIEDITKQIYLKKELKQKEEMLIQQSKMASMGEMIGNIAHQWKQPLSVISAFASAIQIDCDMDTVEKDKIEECSQVTLDQIEYLSATIDDFKDFFKPSHSSQSFNLKKYIEKCINLVKAAFDSNTIELRENIDEKINSYGHPEYFIQAFINILNNAKDALKSIKNIEEKLVFICTIETKDEFVEMYIRDNAGGIPENIIDKVFDPYFTTKDKGTGLGLHITKSIITKNLNGKINVKNIEFIHNGVKYKGAEFKITLPLDK